ncbi:MAG: DUF1343 domain-containing protein [Flavobacteriaceae bacterium]|nr:DUF1343 domain-containing protein [Flavobacteriaceae bacterium]
MSYKTLKSHIHSRSHRIKSTLLVLIIIAGCLPTKAQSLEENLIVGAERIGDYIEQLENKNIAIVANATSVVRRGNRNSYTHLVDTLLSRKIEVSKIFSPEHGFRTIADAGEKVSSSIDPKTGIEIVSLYGKQRKPTKEDLNDVDLILFDIQDVGVRFYTYIATLQYIMEAAADNHIPLIVLDRPNPNGDLVDGPVMEKENTSFLGLQPIPLVYGLTIGEYARLLNEENWLETEKSLELKVIQMDNYDRTHRYHLPIKPSPNLPNAQSIALYPSLGLFEGTHINAGRGTPQPFQRYGSKDLDQTVFSFNYEVTSTQGAKYPKQLGELCYGEDLSLVEVPKKVSLHWLLKAYHHHKGAFFKSESFKLHSGQSALEEMIQSGFTENQIRATWEKDLEAFKVIRSRHIMYP